MVIKRKKLPFYNWAATYIDWENFHFNMVPRIPMQLEVIFVIHYERKCSNLGCLCELKPFKTINDALLLMLFSEVQNKFAVL